MSLEDPYTHAKSEVRKTGDRVRREMTYQGLDIKDLADRVFVSPVIVERILEGYENTTIMQLMSISDGLEKHISCFVGDAPIFLFVDTENSDATAKILKGVKEVQDVYKGKDKVVATFVEPIRTLEVLYAETLVNPKNPTLYLGKKDFLARDYRPDLPHYFIAVDTPSQYVLQVGKSIAGLPSVEFSGLMERGITIDHVSGKMTTPTGNLSEPDFLLIRSANASYHFGTFLQTLRKTKDVENVRILAEELYLYPVS